MEPTFMLVTKLLQRVSVKANSTSFKVMFASLALFIGQSNVYGQATTCAGGLQESTTSNSHTIMCTASDFSISSSVTITDSGFGLYTLSELNNATATDSFGTPVSENEQLIDATCYEFTSTDSATSGAIYSATVFDNVGFTDVNEASCAGGGGGPGPGPGPGTIPDAPMVTSPTSTTAATYVVSGTHTVDGTIISVVIDSNNNGLIDVTEFPATGAVSVIGGNWSTAPIAISSTTTFLVVANDPISGLPSDVVAHNVTINTPPTAPGDSVSVNEGDSVNITLPGSDVDNDDLDYNITSSPSKGTLGVLSNNTVTYTATPGESGSDSFTYTVSDGLATTTGTITIQISANSAPTINGTPLTTATIGRVYSFSVSANDPDGRNTELRFSQTGFPPSISINTTSGLVSGTPTAAEEGTYPDIIITVTDEAGKTASLQPFTLTVKANTPPTAPGDSVSVNEGDSVNITLPGSDVDNDDLDYNITSSPSKGTLGVLSNNTVTYTATPGESGSDSFTYTVSDGLATTTGTITIQISANSAPTINGTPLTTATIGRVYSFSVSANDPDGRNTELRFSQTGFPPSISINTTSGLVSGTPTAAEEGTYPDIIITVTDEAGKTASLQPFTLTVKANTPPTAPGDSVSVNEGDSVNITLPGSDVDNDDLDYNITSSPSKGTLGVLSNNTVTYTATPGESGSDSFTYTVSDGLATTTGTITIQISANSAPTINGTPLTTATIGRVYSFSVSANDPDGRNTELRFSQTGFPPSISINTTSGLVSGTPTAAEEGTYPDIIITVTDEAGKTASLQPFTLTVKANTPPTAPGDSVSVNEGDSVNITLPGSDVDNDDLDYNITSSPSKGTLGVLSNNTVTYTATPGESGSDSFTYTVSDGLATTTGTITIQISANSAPTINGTPLTTATIGRVYSFSVSANDPDGRNTELRFSQTGFPPSISINTTSGLVSGTPTAAEEGTYPDIIITVTDEAGKTASLQPFTLTVKANTPPTAAGDDVPVNEGETVTITLPGSDADGDDLEYSIASSPSKGSLFAINGNSVNYVANFDVSGQDSFNYTVSDGLAATTGTITIQIDAAPIITGTPLTTATVGRAYSFSVSANDPGGDNTALRFSQTGFPASISIDAISGLVSGTPTADEEGTFSNIVITVTDEAGKTASLRSFDLSVNANTPPTAPDQHVPVDEGGSINISLSGNDADDDALEYSIASSPTYGTLSVISGNTVTYTSTSGESDSDSFTYTVSDGIDTTTGTIYIQINTNYAPIITGTSLKTGTVGRAYSFSVSANDPDGNNGELRFSQTGFPASISIDATSGLVSGTPTADEEGTYPDIIITVTDEKGKPASLEPFTLTVKANTPPKAPGDNVSVNEGETVTITLPGSDVDDDDLDYDITSSPSKGTLGELTNNTVTYTPTPGESGSDSFTYTVSDGLATTTGTITIQINVNLAPTITGSPSTTATIGREYRFQPIADDPDGDNTKLEFSFLAPTNPDFLSIDENTGLVSGTPSEDSKDIVYTGITILVTDEKGDSASLEFSLTVIENTPPEARDYSRTIRETESAYIHLSTTDENDGDPLTYSFGSPSNGTVYWYPESEELYYEHSACYKGDKDSFTYTVSDGLASSTGTVSITITAFNVQPTNDRTLDSGYTSEGAKTYSFKFGDYFYDRNCDELTYTFSDNIYELVESYTFEGETAVFTLGEKSGSETITLTVSDGKGGSLVKNWNFTVNPGNDAPEWTDALPTQIEMKAGETHTFNLKEWVSDVDSSWEDGTLVVDAFSSDQTAVTASTSSAVLTINALDEGEGTHTVYLQLKDSATTVPRELRVIVTPDTSLQLTCESELELTAHIGEAFEYEVDKCFKNADTIELGSITRSNDNLAVDLEWVLNGQTIWASATVTDNGNVISGTPTRVDRDSTVTVDVRAVGGAPESSITQKIKIKASNTGKPIITAPPRVDINITGASMAVPYNKLLPSDDIPFDRNRALQNLIIRGDGTPRIVTINDKSVNIDISEDHRVVIFPSSQVRSLDSLPSGKHSLGWQLVTPGGEKSEIVYQEVNIWPQYSFSPNTVYEGEEHQSLGRHTLSGPLSGITNGIIIDLEIQEGPCATSIELPDSLSISEGNTELSVVGYVEEIPRTNPVDVSFDYCSFLISPNASINENYPNFFKPTGRALFNSYLNSDGVAKIKSLQKESKAKTTTQSIYRPRLQSVIRPQEFPLQSNNRLRKSEAQLIIEAIDFVPIRTIDQNKASSSSTEIATSNASSMTAAQEAFPLEFVQDGDDITLQLPAGLESGVYQISLELEDIEGRIEQSTILITVVNAFPELSIDEDTDGDGLVDLAEGVIDTNANGIVDYLDNITYTYQLPLHYELGALIQCRAGYLCALGPYALGAGGDGAAITLQEWSQLSQTNLPDSITAISEIHDFTVRDLQNVGQTVHVVIPLTQPIANNAVYSTYAKGAWSSWVEDEFTTLSSSPSDITGVCPSAGAESYRSGLNPGDVCVQLPLVDGGANDADGIANGEIYFTGVLTLANNQLPVLEVDTLTLPVNQFGTINVLENDTDPDEHVLTLIDVIGDFAEISFTSDGDVEVTPYDNYTGTQLLRYLVQDSEGAYAESALVVTVEQNQAPVAQSDIASTDDRTSIVIDVLANDSDPENGALIIDQVQAEHGTVSIVNNQIRYTPAIGFEGVDTIIYYVEDSLEADALGVVEVTVQAYQTVVSENKSGGSIGTGMMALLLMAALIRRRATLLTAVALLVVSHASLAQGWYTQFEIGQASAEKPATPAQASVVNYDLNDTMWAVTLGYQLSESWALESSYLDLGDSKITLEQLTLQPDVTEQELAAIQPLLTQGVTLGARYTLLQKNGWSVSVPLGLYRWKTDAQSGSGNSISTKERNGSDWFTGILINVKLSNHLKLGANYRYIDLEPGKVDTFSLSATYLF